MKARMPFVLVVLVALALPQAVRAQGGAGPPGGPPRGMLPGGPGREGPSGPPGEWGPPPPGPGVVGLRLPPPEVIERLKLSESQREKFDDLMDTERRKSIRTEGELRIAELDLQKQVESDRPDAGAIDEAITRLGELRGDLLTARVATLVAFRALLTAEQRSKLRRPPPEMRWH